MNQHWLSNDVEETNTKSQASTEFPPIEIHTQGTEA